MTISVTDLPEKYQAQAVKKYMEQQARKGAIPNAGVSHAKPRENKYHNTPTEQVTSCGAVLRFDSQKEARRYDQLILLEQAGKIRDLRLQVDFTLQEAYTDAEENRVRAIRYKADFTYWKHERHVVEDVKSKPTKTKTYAMKRKMLKDRFGLDITEVYK